jgi:hypothetical protein
MVGRPRDLDAYETLVREHQLIAFRTAYVITGSAADDPAGQMLEAPARLAGHTLVWRRGRLTLRVEADIPKQRALAIARLVR